MRTRDKRAVSAHGEEIPYLIYIVCISILNHSMLYTDNTPFSPPATTFLGKASRLQRELPVWKLSMWDFMRRSQLLMLLSWEQENKKRLSLGCVLTHETDSLWPSRDNATFSLAMSITLIVVSSEAVRILLLSSVNPIDLTILWWGFKFTLLSLFSRLKIWTYPLLLPNPNIPSVLAFAMQVKKIYPA